MADHPEQATSPLRQAMIAQALGAVPAAALILLFPALLAKALTLALVQGLGAAVISRLRGDPVWWLPIHLGFLPLAVLARKLDLAPSIWLAGFAMLLLIFWRTDRSRVPLYLTNAPSGASLAALLPERPAAVIDLGCGDGSLLRRLARARPDCRFVGFEHAPLTWAWAWLRCRRLANVEVRFGDFWTHSLAGYDLVYAFLSPAAMPALWEKARAEMKFDSQLVSNSFAVPDVLPQGTIDIDDRRRTCFFLYQPAG